MYGEVNKAISISMKNILVSFIHLYIIIIHIGIRGYSPIMSTTNRFFLGGEILTLADEGGRGVPKMLTLADE